MTLLSRFVDEAEHHREVAGCPLRTLPPSADESACAGCRYNVLWPGKGAVGCAMLTPPSIFHDAEARLAARDPALAAELAALRKDPVPVDRARAECWLRLVDAWAAGDLDDAEREVAAVAARFARASIRLDTPVTILGAR